MMMADMVVEEDHAKSAGVGGEEVALEVPSVVGAAGGARKNNAVGSSGGGGGGVLSCPICKREPPLHPVITTSCSHIFCEGCLALHCSRGDTETLCPRCGQALSGSPQFVRIPALDGVRLPQEKGGRDAKTRKKAEEANADRVGTAENDEAEDIDVTGINNNPANATETTTTSRKSRSCSVLMCEKSAQGGTVLCIAHGGGRRCQFAECRKLARGSTRFCVRHGGGKRCKVEGCPKAGDWKSGLCIAHGGGKACSMEGCKRSAVSPTLFCVRHGGGNRCQVEGCTSSAISPTMLCKKHGGGKRCKWSGCNKAAQGPSLLCIRHGGGKRCIDGEGTPFKCNKLALSGGNYCRQHNRSSTCKVADCTKKSYRASVFCTDCKSSRKSGAANDATGNHDDHDHDGDAPINETALLKHDAS